MYRFPHARRGRAPQERYGLPNSYSGRLMRPSSGFAHYNSGTYVIYLRFYLATMAPHSLNRDWCGRWARSMYSVIITDDSFRMYQEARNVCYRMNLRPRIFAPIRYTMNIGFFLPIRYIFSISFSRGFVKWRTYLFDWQTKSDFHGNCQKRRPPSYIWHILMRYLRRFNLGRVVTPNKE